MSELLPGAEQRKTELIEQLISHGIYKTTGKRHLYDASLKVLEEEYERFFGTEVKPVREINRSIDGTWKKGQVLNEGT